MKKMKKFLAMLLAMAMVLGMSITSFAAGATLTVKGAGEAATFRKLQVIEADPTTATGWNFTSAEAADAYMSAFGSVGEDEDGLTGATAVSAQEAIAMLILAAKGDAKLPDSLSHITTAATAGQIGKALSNVKEMLSDDFVAMTNGETVNEAGVYAVLATEPGYTYNNMAIYVGFGPANDGAYPAITSEAVDAKRSPNTITKENLGEAADNAVAVGDTVEFRVTSSFPFVDANATDKFYAIQDILTGAEFDMSSFVVTIGGRALVENEDYTVTGIAQNEGTAPEIMINFNPALFDDANSLAGQEVIVTYSATVTEVDAHNTVNHSGTGIEGATPSTTDLYTGSIEITKNAEDGSVLEGAEFVVARPVTTAVEDRETGDNMGIDVAMEYATFDTTNSRYVLSGWVTDIEDATHVTTGTDGKAKVEGLDVNNYAFIEVKAPEGYSINEEPSIAELDFAGDVATAVFTANTSMTDTRVASLPSTGGIGTTIFTIGGCAIMIIAAGLYFSLRRRTAK